MMDAISSATPDGPEARSPARWTPEKAAAAFAACARCSFFLAGYRLLHQDFETAVSESDGQTLLLSWDGATGRLLEKAYGFQLAADCYHFERVCRDCWRPFAVDVGDEARPGELRFRIQPG